MVPSCPRRSVLQMSSVGFLLLGSGCSTTSSTGTITVSLVNTTERPHIVHAEVLRDDDTVWSQRADVPPDRGDPPTDDAIVETAPAVTDIADGSEFIVRAWLDSRSNVESEGLVINNTDEDSEESVTIRIMGGDENPWITIST